MSRFRIEKDTFEVRFALNNSTEVRGYVFLSGLNPITGTRETLQDLLKDQAVFLPVRQEDGQVLLVNKHMIASASLPLDADPTPAFTQRIPCTLEISGPGEIRGDLIIPQLPEGFRVSDHLNSKERWFRIEGGDWVHIVNPEAVAYFRL